MTPKIIWGNGSFGMVYGCINGQCLVEIEIETVSGITDISARINIGFTPQEITVMPKSIDAAKFLARQKLTAFFSSIEYEDE